MDGFLSRFSLGVSDKPGASRPLAPGCRRSAAWPTSISQPLREQEVEVIEAVGHPLVYTRGSGRPDLTGNAEGN